MAEPTVERFKGKIRLVTAYELIVLFVCVQGYNLATAPSHEVFWLAVFVGSVPIYLYFLLRRLIDSYELTSDYITMYTGILWRQATRIPLNKVADASANRRLLARFLGVGDILVNSPGTNHYEVTMRDMGTRDIRRLIAVFDSVFSGRAVAEKSGEPRVAAR